MSTIYEYVNMRGDLSPLQFPYNEVDFLLFSLLAYVHLDDIDLTKQEYTIKELLPIYLKKLEMLNQEDKILYQNESHILFLEMASSLRYQNIKVLSYENEVNKELVKQFSAMTFLLEDESLVVSYRGTDESLIGWHEDFLMLCNEVIPAQLSACEYLQKNFHYSFQQSIFQSLKNPFLGKTLKERIKKYFLLKKGRPLYLVGHSKGGNLAMYAGCFTNDEIKERIQFIYNFDGPGFHDNIIESKNYQKMLNKIVSYQPHYSFFGIVLTHEEDYHVVKSVGKGMLQHNGFTWCVHCNEFVYDELSMESVDFAIKVLLFLNKLTQEEKQIFVETMFGLFDSLSLYSFSDLSHISYKQILNAIKELSLIQPHVRKMLIEVIHMLWLEAKKIK